MIWITLPSTIPNSMGIKLIGNLIHHGLAMIISTERMEKDLILTLFRIQAMFLYMCLIFKDMGEAVVAMHGTMRDSVII